jgi:predicted membrane protein
MTITLIIIAYILNIFLNRCLNYILYKMGGIILIPSWFLSIIGTCALLVTIIINYINKKNWFTGRDWDKK